MTVLDVPDRIARDIYGYDLILVRPDLHVVWRGNARARRRCRSRGDRHGTFRPRVSRHQPGGIDAIAAPPMAQNTTTSHGGVLHMNSKRKAATPSAKSPALVIPEVQTGL